MASLCRQGVPLGKGRNPGNVCKAGYAGTAPPQFTPADLLGNVKLDFRPKCWRSAPARDSSSRRQAFGCDRRAPAWDPVTVCTAVQPGIWYTVPSPISLMVLHTQQALHSHAAVSDGRACAAHLQSPWGTLVDEAPGTLQHPRVPGDGLTASLWG